MREPDFVTIYNFTREQEGGYANVRGDSGGETYKGIARIHHASWVGWKVIDAHKNHPDYKSNPSQKTMTRLLGTIPSLAIEVRAFYYREFYEVAGCDQHEYNIALALFDFAVHSSPVRAKKYLIFAQKYHDTPLLEFYIDLREAFLRKLAEQPSQRKFLAGWMARLTALRKEVGIIK